MQKRKKMIVIGALALSSALALSQKEKATAFDNLTIETAVAGAGALSFPMIPVELTFPADVAPSKQTYSVYDVELLSLVAVGEAESESEAGKRLVIDTALNRVDSDEFPDTVYDVVYQKNAFESMWNGRLERVTVTNEIRQLVKEELSSRSNTEVLYFGSKGYSKYGTPLFKLGNHYFSGK